MYELTTSPDIKTETKVHIHIYAAISGIFRCKQNSLNELQLGFINRR